MLDHAGGGVGEAADVAACDVDVLAAAPIGDVELDVLRGTGGGREEPKPRSDAQLQEEAGVFNTVVRTGRAHLSTPIFEMRAVPCSTASPDTASSVAEVWLWEGSQIVELFGVKGASEV
jgi:hypothetical protein